MTPKSLLRNKLCVSSLSAMGAGTTFHRVMHDVVPLCSDKSVARVIICSGKIYYDLLHERAKRKIKNIFLLRLEQLYPFPKEALLNELARFPEAEVVWCQEEPENMGAWTFVDRKLEEALVELGGQSLRARYIGRPEAASPATGSLGTHNAEQVLILDEALSKLKQGPKKSVLSERQAAE